MDSLVLVLALASCVAASAVLGRVARLPLPLTQIALGAALGMPPLRLHVALEPQLFMLLFIPPLLFADGWRMPKREFLELRERILGLALGLVLFTVVAIGYLLHAMIPELPLAAAFALAAVLSPTDAVAFSALAGRYGIPRRLAYLLQGEAMMNDASGVTAFNFAVAAAVTGTFSIRSAGLSFLWIAGGGLAVGVALGWAMATFQKRLAGWTQIEAQGTIVLILLLPFAAYLLAEQLGASGILAAVAAGMSLNLRGATVDSGVQTRLALPHIWEVVEYLLNGIVFVLIGLQLPDIIGAALEDIWQQQGVSGLARVFGYVVAITLALMLTRLVWVSITVRIARLYARLRGAGGGPAPRLRLVLAGVLGGVRGAITLAAVLSLPLRLGDGSLFPGRELMIFLATSVILVMLVAAAFGLPLVLRGLDVETDREVEDERRARIRACEAAIAAVAVAVNRADSQRSDAVAERRSNAVAHIVSIYEARLHGLREAGDDHGSDGRDRSDRALRLVGLRAERAELQRLHRDNEINDAVLRKLQYELDLREQSLVLPAQ